MRKAVRALLNFAGYDVVRLHSNNETLAGLLKNIFRFYQIECVIDVGANSGQYGRFLRELGYTGHIFSFEPVSSVFNKLAENAKGDSKWHCYKLALGERAETKQINVYSSTVFSSFLDATDYAKNIWSSLKDVHAEKVEVITLDGKIDEIKQISGCDILYLKLDTQGYDMNVFRGAANSLKHVEAMQTELSMIHVYENTLPPLKVLAEFFSKNYCVAGMYPINRDESLAVIEFDCVLVKRPAI